MSQRRCKVGERRVLVVIDPGQGGNCTRCRFMAMGTVWRCRLGFATDGSWSSPRPADCIAAEAEVEALQGGIIDRVQRASGRTAQKRDRVTDALAAVLGPEPVEL